MGGLTIQYAKLPETKRNSSLRIQRTKSSQPVKTPAGAQSQRFCPAPAVEGCKLEIAISAS